MGLIAPCEAEPRIAFARLSDFLMDGGLVNDRAETGPRAAVWRAVFSPVLIDEPEGLTVECVTAL
jgi:hypothetical protein